MKKKINRFKNVMNSHPRIFVTILVLILLIVIFVLYRIADKYLNFSTSIDDSFYVYVGKQKYDFDGTIMINKKDVISDLKPSKNINFTTSPVYSKNKMLFVNTMILVSDTKEYRTMPYSYINLESGNLVSTKFDELINEYIIFDSVDTYIILDAGELTANGNTIKLSKYSYLICTSDRLDYYDYQSDTYNIVDLTDKNVTLKVNSLDINVSDDTINGNINLPSTFDYINIISKDK